MSRLKDDLIRSFQDQWIKVSNNFSSEVPEPSASLVELGKWNSIQTFWPADQGSRHPYI